MTLRTLDLSLSIPAAQPVIIYLASLREPILGWIGSPLDFDAVLGDITVQLEQGIQAQGSFRVQYSDYSWCYRRSSPVEARTRGETRGTGMPWRAANSRISSRCWRLGPRLRALPAAAAAKQMATTPAAHVIAARVRRL